MSEEMRKADVWYTKECACPYCDEVMETDQDSFEIETCMSCGKQFELGEFQL